MAESLYEFERFFNREGFNRALSHFQAVSSLLEDFEDGFNLADILSTLVAEKEIAQEQLSPVLYALLVDKYGYRCGSCNPENTLDDFSHLKSECSTWNGVDVVLAYHHPELGFTVLNPKNPAHWDAVQNIRKNELVTIYAGGVSEGISDKIAEKAIDLITRLLQGKKVKSPAILQDGDFVYESYDSGFAESSEEPSHTPTRQKPRRETVRASASSPDESDSSYDEEEQDSEPETPAARAPDTSGNRRMSPMYSVPVTNELFHNGNVEAWKKIIQSYQLKYSSAEVLVFYEGERIHDINTLFKWGKVKHGSSILFAVVGENIKDVAKLQRYFRQGASPQFEAFLRVPVNTVLKLF